MNMFLKISKLGGYVCNLKNIDIYPIALLDFC